MHIGVDVAGVGVLLARKCQELVSHALVQSPRVVAGDKLGARGRSAGMRGVQRREQLVQSGERGEVERLVDVGDGEVLQS